MRKLGKDEKVETVTTAQKQNKAVYEFLRTFNVGDEAVVDWQDWKGKTKLAKTIHNHYHFKGLFSCKTLKEHKGWWIKRIK